MPLGTWPWRSHGGTSKHSVGEKQGVRARFQGGMACHHLMGQVSEFVSCLKPQWEDTPGKRPQGPRMGICLPTVFWGPECPVMARYRCGPLWGESSWA